MLIGLWVPIFDSHRVLFIGALIGVFVHLPIAALIGLAH